MSHPINPYEKRDPPWWYFFLATITFSLAGYAYYYFTDFEEKGGERRLQWIIAMLYDFGGKWSVIGFACLLGGFCVFLGIKEMQRKQ